MTTATITLRIGRDTLDPQGTLDDATVAAGVDYIASRVVSDLRDDYAEVDATVAGVGGRTSGMTSDGDVIDSRVRGLVQEAYQGWLDTL